MKSSEPLIHNPYSIITVTGIITDPRKNPDTYLILSIGLLKITRESTRIDSSCSLRGVITNAAHSIEEVTRKYYRYTRIVAIGLISKRLSKEKFPTGVPQVISSPLFTKIIDTHVPGNKPVSVQRVVSHSLNHQHPEFSHLDVI